MHGIQFCVIFTLMFFKLLKCSENRIPLIINGENAKIENFPHSVFLFMDCKGLYRCGSSILNQDILLTAAHCLCHCGINGKIHAFAGHENINKAMVRRRGKSVLFHEDYIYDNRIYDIGLVFIDKSLPLGNTMKRVILTKQNSVGLTAVVAGWGIINEYTKEYTSILKFAKQVVKPLGICLKRRQQMPGTTCAVNININRAGPSNGDSGSALVVENYKQIGLVAFKCPVRPGIIFYTNTSYFYDWIKEKLIFLIHCKINNSQYKLRNYYELNI